MQFQDDDIWYTVRDYNPDTKNRQHYDDTKARKYLDPDMFIVKVSGSEVSARLEIGAIKGKNNILERFRFAVRFFRIITNKNGIRYQFKWVYEPIRFEKDSNDTETGNQ